jgi:hypothetical protein
MDPDQPGHPRSLIRIHAVCLQTLLQVEKLPANSMDPDQAADVQADLNPCLSQTHYVGFWRGPIIVSCMKYHSN